MNKNTKLRIEHLFHRFLYERFGQMKYRELASDFIEWLVRKGYVKDDDEIN